MIDWFTYIKRYVWDDDTTPYLVPASKMSKGQADNEVFFYALLMAVFFAVVSLASVSGEAPYGRSNPAGGYAFSVVTAAVLLWMVKHVWAALWCATAPLVGLGAMFLLGFPQKMALLDELVVLAITLAIFRYSFRIIRICQAYPALPVRPMKGRRRKRTLF